MQTVGSASTLDLAERRAQVAAGIRAGAARTVWQNRLPWIVEAAIRCLMDLARHTAAALGVHTSAAYSRTVFCRTGMRRSASDVFIRQPWTYSSCSLQNVSASGSLAVSS